MFSVPDPAESSPIFSVPEFAISYGASAKVSIPDNVYSVFNGDCGSSAESGNIPKKKHTGQVNFFINDSLKQLS